MQPRVVIRHDILPNNQPVRLSPIHGVGTAPCHGHADDASDDAMRGRDVEAIVGSDELKDCAEPQDHAHPKGQSWRVLHEGA